MIMDINIGNNTSINIHNNINFYLISILPPVVVLVEIIWIWTWILEFWLWTFTEPFDRTRYPVSETSFLLSLSPNRYTFKLYDRLTYMTCWYIWPADVYDRPALESDVRPCIEGSMAKRTTFPRSTTPAWPDTEKKLIYYSHCFSLT